MLCPGAENRKEISRRPFTGTVPIFAAGCRKNGTAPFGPQGDRHIFRAIRAREMSQSPACERLPGKNSHGEFSTDTS